ncbi:MAG: SDR family NAD(P)-dependent oxidoreductase [Alteromonadaceae bacterium]|nr:SDR family NAD(P)-dependent oxidoreductase [Alteromonadaceae bacterium]
MAEIFKQQGNVVYALCRQSSKPLDALGVNVIENIDVSTDEGLLNMSSALKNISIEVLVCNGGIFRNESLSELNAENIRQQFEVNALAPLRIVDALQGNLVQYSKVAMITSRMGSIADNDSGGFFGYRMSKAALNAASMSLSIDLASRDIAVGIYHPGYVQTDMTNHGGDISANEAASRLVGLINNLTMAETGVFKHSNGEVLPW